MRILNHFHETNGAGNVIVILLFIIALIICAYIFYWHHETYASMAIDEAERESKEEKDDL